MLHSYRGEEQIEANKNINHSTPNLPAENQEDGAGTGGFPPSGPNLLAAPFPCSLSEAFRGQAPSLRPSLRSPGAATPPHSRAAAGGRGRGGNGKGTGIGWDGTKGTGRGRERGGAGQKGRGGNGTGRGGTGRKGGEERDGAGTERERGRNGAGTGRERGGTGGGSGPALRRARCCGATCW